MSNRGTSLRDGHTWRDDALCREIDPDVFLVDRGPEASYARSVCAICPVAEECLEAAMESETGDHTHRAGIRGGLTPRQRSGLATRRRADGSQAARTGGKPLSPCGTPAAYDRHVRNGERIDDACREAHNANNRAKRTRARGPVECGTRRGYQKHRRDGEEACDACRYANAAADRRLRTTGSTVPSA